MNDRDDFPESLVDVAHDALGHDVNRTRERQTHEDARDVTVAMLRKLAITARDNTTWAWDAGDLESFANELEKPHD